jgi:hypothetical protein
MQPSKTTQALWLVAAICLYPLLSSAQFIDRAADFGILHGYGENQYGGGVSFCDFDQDGDDDLSFASEFGEDLYFYRNNGGTYELIDPPLVSNQDETEQLLWFDFDNDGDQDLFVTVNWGSGSKLYENDGGNFIDITAAAGLSTDSLPTYTACIADFDRDSWLDIYVCNRSGFVHPYSNILYRNLGNGQFEDVTLSANAGAGIQAPLAVLFHDFNDDLWPDILIANDRGFGNQLLQNQQDGTFLEISLSSGFYQEMNAMGITPGDFDSDGDFDYYISNTPEGNALMQNDASGGFDDVAADQGCAFYGIAWGVHFLDVDNDRDLDLFSGGLYQAPENVPSVIYENDGAGNFLPGFGFVDSLAQNYGNAMGDLNSDGYPDLAVVNIDPFQHRLWQNPGGSNNWAKIQPQGQISNRDGIGSLIEIEHDGITQKRYMHCGTSYLGQDAHYAWYGLGTSDVIDRVLISWPSGLIDEWTNLDVNQLHQLQEGSSLNAEEILEQQIQLYPNPASDVIYVSWPKSLSTHELSILNLQGQLIWSCKINAGETQRNIPVGQLESGNYLMKLETDQGSLQKLFIRY